MQTQTRRAYTKRTHTAHIGVRGIKKANRKGIECAVLSRVIATTAAVSGDNSPKCTPEKRDCNGRTGCERMRVDNHGVGMATQQNTTINSVTTPDVNAYLRVATLAGRRCIPEERGRKWGGRRVGWERERKENLVTMSVGLSNNAQVIVRYWMGANTPSHGVRLRILSKRASKTALATYASQQNRAHKRSSRTHSSWQRVQHRALVNH